MKIISSVLNRKNFIALLCISSLVFCNGFTSTPRPSFAASLPIVAYRELKVNLPQYDVDVPVAVWFNTDDENAASINKKAVYQHRISVQKIGSMLANLNFIPSFAAKDFALTPTTTRAITIDGSYISIPQHKPVIFLAHGFLGSRFDLSHLAEELAREGFVCFSPEYPESLASSYSTKLLLDRNTINAKLLEDIEMRLDIKPSSYGIVGHSLGCGTALNTGDNTWTRVTIAGPMARRDGIPLNGNILGIVSLGDGLINRERLETMIPSNFERLQEEALSLDRSNAKKIPSKSVLVFDRPNAPNHISFLAGSANDSMVSFLSPLLPLAQALSIPVLDFDKYQESQDSDATADVVIPLVSQFLKQNMMVSK